MGQLGWLERLKRLEPSPQLGKVKGRLVLKTNNLRTLNYPCYRATHNPLIQDTGCPKEVTSIREANLLTFSGSLSSAYSNPGDDNPDDDAELQQALAESRSLQYNRGRAGESSTYVDNATTFRHQVDPSTYRYS
ncbi:hypothetical protein SLS62_011194 [Diatrype stigma]|uniref:Uncharacterized protein n=1 Tax=Diatrype stigma TaxID=117547 RepID=A0AAN9YFU2_9PEZI